MPEQHPKRIVALDVLRGFALLGMFIVHFHVRSSESGAIDEVIRTAIWRLVEGKSHGTFAFLFGAGFAIQLRLADARGQALARTYLRRLAVLAMFGFVAHACFGFNVLLGYATWGVALLVIRRWSTPALLATAALCAVSVSLYQVATASFTQLTFGADPSAIASAQHAAAAEVNQALRTAAAGDSYAALFRARLRHMAWFYTQPFFFMPGATMTLFIAGLLSIRHGLIEHANRHRQLLMVVAVFGLVSWLADNWLLSQWGVTTLGLLRDQWLTFTYVGIALVVLAVRPAWLLKCRHIASAGRMALTNYLLQIATLDVLFSGYGAGLGQVRPLTGLIAAFTCFAAEAALSSWWLAHFRFGPAEWMWRTLTYGRLQPLRRIVPQRSLATVDEM